MVITEVATAAAPTAVGAVLTADGAPINGGAFRWANQINTLATRSRLNIPIMAGTFVGATQF
jgi:hypothetical protein